MAFSLIRETESYAAALESLKAYGPKVFGSGVFTPNELAQAVAREEVLLHVDGPLACVLLDQGYFSRGFFYVAHDPSNEAAMFVSDDLAKRIGTLLATHEKPVVVELTFMRERSSLQEKMVAAWRAMGFSPLRRVARVQADLRSEEVRAALSKPAREPLEIEAPLTTEALSQAQDLWHEQIERFQSRELDSETLAARNEAGLVSAVVKDGIVRAALMTNVQGARVTMGPVATREEWKGRGYASALYRSRLLELHENDGVNRAVAWIDVRNVPSFALHEALGFVRDGSHIESFSIPALR